MTVRQLLRELDSQELADWMVYYNREHYRKALDERSMDTKQRSQLLKDTLFRKHLYV